MYVIEATRAVQDRYRWRRGCQCHSGCMRFSRWIDDDDNVEIDYDEENDEEEEDYEE